MTSPDTAIERHHHLTICAGDAQEDYDFHTKVLGMKSVKKTALYDGTVPIYHLYYGNDMGEESELIGGCTPRPRKLKKASNNITPGTVNVA
jgi:glyoxalase family protein